MSKNKSQKVNSRESQIVRTGAIGIGSNVGLVVLKAIVGFITGSVSIILDAVNNLTDALSSLITIIGTKLANRPADKKHPFGHGRIEYLTSFFVAIIILAAGIFAIVESIEKIITPSEVSFNVISIVLISIAIVVKIGLGLFTINRGKKLKSEALIGSGKDAFFDALITTSTLVGMIVFMASGVNIDGYLGALVSIFIIKSGVELIYSSIVDLIGKRADAKLVSDLIETVKNAFPEVLGVYDVFLESYGPEKLTGSFHVEVSNTLTADDIDLLTRKITGLVYQKYQFITTVGIYAVENKDEEAIKLKNQIYEIVKGIDGVLQIHGYRHFKENNMISMDVVKDFKIKDEAAFRIAIRKALEERFPQYNYVIVIDTDMTLSE